MKINCNLSVSSIDKAIKELTDYKRDFEKKVDLFRSKVAEYVQKQADKDFNGAIVDDIIKGGTPKVASPTNVDVVVKGENITTVIATGDDILWIEFGAGVYHNGAVGSSPNPYGKKLKYTIGSYGKGKGKFKAWAYRGENEDDWVITRGTKAIMPMAKSISEVINNIDKIAKEVFG